MRRALASVFLLPSLLLLAACGSPPMGDPDGGSGTDSSVRVDSGSCRPAPEVCDSGVDEDCDGLIDEGCGPCSDGETQACGVDVGACMAGTQTCAGGAWGACEGSVGPSAEVCEGSVDEDCDGTVDNGCDCAAGMTRSCGLGMCAGTETCEGGAWSVCRGASLPSPDVCGSGMDEDCDGMIDETCECMAGETQPCGSDVGACTPGRQACDAGMWGPCMGAGGASPEVCEGSVDEDCDGVVDNGCACTNGMTRACTTSCGPGMETCVAGAWGACVGPGGAETCNAMDDDCDGTIDEGATGGICGCTFVTHMGSTYYICSRTGAGGGATWTQARMFCQASGYDLAVIDDAAEQAALWAAAQMTAADDWWLGLNDRMVEGRWVWLDGAPVTYTAWDVGAPNGGGTDDCARMRRTTMGGWNDIGCDQNYGWICEANP